MNIKGFLLICLCAISTISFSQIAFEADSLYTQVKQVEDVVAYNQFKNQVPQLHNFKWTRNIVEMTDGWENAICDENGCYLPHINEAEIEMGPNGSSRLDLHIYPNGIFTGYAAIEITVAYANDPTVNSIAYFFFEGSTTTNTEEPSIVNVKMYPNPNQGLLTIEDQDQKVKSLKVIDLLGRVHTNIAIGSGQMINLAHLSNGNYMVQMYGEDHVYLGHKMMTKQ